MSTIASKSLQLRQFAEGDLTPSAEYTREGDRLANLIFNHLRSNTNYIDRVCISGSMGKRTSLGDDQEPDFDLVLFCNGKEPPLKSVVLDFVKILEHTSIRIVRHNDHMAHVKWNGYNFDVCPAPNFVTTHGSPDPATYERQRNAVYAKIRGSSNPVRMASELSTGLAESARKFLQMQSSFVHSVVRLAKYWNKNVGGGHFQGRKLLIEIVAVEAGRESEVGWEDNRERTYRALERFLRKMMNFDELRCIFKEYYNVHDVPPEFHYAKPLVLDPANPWNNLADNCPTVARRSFEQRARAALDKLQSYGETDVKLILA